MSTWSSANQVITDLGNNLLAQARIGLGTIKITRVVSREDFESDIADLRAYTLADITASIAQEGQIIKKETVPYPDPSESVETSLLSVRFSNDDLESGDDSYSLRQIVILASLVDAETGIEGSEVPYMVCQCDDSTDCDIMPARTDNPTSFDYDIYIIHSGVSSITIALRTSGYVFADEYAQDKDELYSAIDKKPGQNTDEVSFNTWTPVYSNDHSEWSSDSTGETATGTLSSERFNCYDANKNIVTGNYSSAFGYNSEVLGDKSYAFGDNNYISEDASMCAVEGSKNAIRAGQFNKVSGTLNEVILGNGNVVFGLKCKHNSGSYNTIMSNGTETTNCNHSIIATSGEVTNSESSVVAGVNSDISDIENSLIVGEDITASNISDSVIIGKSIESDNNINVIGGQTIISTGDCTGTIVTGSNNEITTSQNSEVFGTNNNLNNSPASCLSGRYGNIRNSTASFTANSGNTITSGGNNTAFGSGNSCLNSEQAVITGTSNNISICNNSFISGNHHSVYNSPNITVLGSSNTIQAESSQSIIGGNGNRVSHSLNSFIIGSSLNVDYAQDNVVAGSNNRVYGSNKNYSNVISGANNIVYNNRGLGNIFVGYSMISGANNDISDYANSSVTGSNATIKNMVNCTVTGSYVNVQWATSQPNSIGLRNSEISGSNINITQTENAVVSGRNLNVSDYKPNGVAGEWGINTSNSFLAGDSNIIRGIYDSVAVGYNNSISNVHDSIIGGRDNVVSGSNTPAGGYTNSIIVVGKSNNVVSNSYAPQAVFGTNNDVSGGNTLTSGFNLKNSGSNATVLGRYNVEDTNNTYAVIVGGGTGDDSDRANIAALDWNGGLHLNSIYLGSIKNPDGTPYDFGENISYISQGTGFYSVILNDTASNSAGGIYATAFGKQNSVSGNYSVAMGESNNVSGGQSGHSFAMGSNNTVRNAYAYVFGRNNEVGPGGSAEEFNSFVVGTSNNVYTSRNTIVSGNSNTSSYTHNSLLVGSNHTPSHATGIFVSGSSNSIIYSDNSSIIGGNNNNITEEDPISFEVEEFIGSSVIVGGEYNEISNTYAQDSTYHPARSVILGGEHLIVPVSNCVVMGKYNAYEGVTNAALIIGNGTSNIRRNALVVDTQGNIYSGGSSTSLNQDINKSKQALVEVVDSGAKNKLVVTKASIKTANSSGTWSGDTYTRTDNNNNISITINDDMSLTINGSAAARIQFNLSETGLQNFQGYMLSGGNTQSNTISVLFQEVGGSYATIGQDFGTGVNLGNYDSTKSYKVSINISAGTSANNIVIKPMICSKEVWDISNKYVPYCPPMQELYARIQALENRS